jgi:uncharacterized protein
MESLIKRHIKKDIEDHLPKKEITIITGGRQVGKTTLMLQVIDDLKTKNKNVLFLNLDIDTDSKYFESQETLLQKIRLEIGDEGYVFIDEIQRLENSGLFLKGIYDRNLNYKFVISGSGSLDLKAKISESLLGRKRVIEMQSVNFEEFVNFKTNYKYENKLNQFFELEQHQTMLLLNEYLNFGGYPRILLEIRQSEKLKLIDEIFKSYIEKDLVYLLKIERPDVFQGLIKILSAQTGSLITYSTIAGQLNVSVQTLKKYLWFAEKTFSISYVSPFYTNKIKELTKSPVYYFNDLGFRNYAINQMGNLTMNQQYGFVFQNFIFLILKEYIKWKNWSIHYWRTTDKAEVDFIINKTNDILPVEVKYGGFSKPSISRSFRSFIEKYNPQNAWIVNRNFEAELKINSTTVSFIPFYKILQ